MTSELAQPIVQRRGRPGPFLVLALGVGLAPFYLLGLDVPWRGPASSQTVLIEAMDGRLADYSRSIPGRKIVFIGGSNLIFGLRARSLEAALGVPVVNYALNAGLGCDLIAERAMRDVRAGDFVVFAPELSHFRVQPTTEPALRSDWIVTHGSRLREPAAEFPDRQWLLTREGCRMVRRRAEGWTAERSIALALGSRSKPKAAGPTTPYVPDAYDDRANFTFPRPAPKLNRFNTQPWWEKAYRFDSGRGVETLNWLAAECRGRGAVFLVMPGIRLENGDESRQAREGWMARESQWLRIAEDLGASRLLNPGQTAFSKEFGYDTTHHMNDAGDARFESVLIPALRGALARAGTTGR